MTTRQWFLSVVAVLVVGLFVFAAYRSDGFGDRQRMSGGDAPDSLSEESSNSKTYNHVVPPNIEITVPVSLADIAPGVKESSLRVYEVTVSSDGFNPSELVVKGGDVVTLNLTSTDGDYDFYLPDIGLRKMVTRGEKAQIQFQTSVSGVFTFLCDEQCPSSHVIKGTLVVK